ncbi:PKD domain-containing protein [Paenibacillus sp. SYP-B3998]|uniref:PKD domain-containing protein n=1 Tax=Paenibacillus sp. SYP-B3998 TaxID=2678564 RepID=A0A6G4A3R9_9BACL|nr:discoidin domain-containing protein [Paenibacillus sp. SYP-B3998]NEW09113.1 PKD domain-containing protein [Paenibacillus sp. SYP-B3998]
MKKYGLSLMFLLVICLVVPLAVSAKQPQSSYWFPDQLLQWNPKSDSDAEFNRSMIPLQERFMGNKVNPNASKDAKIAALSAMNKMTSGVPSQGSRKFESNTFSYWQYVDKLVYWGGSSGEGIIVPPSADVTDAAHKNGVPVLGTVFFPPNAYGGKFEWVQQFLKQNQDGSFPMADKLIEVAKFYGFDGWFLNQETQGASASDAKKMQAFMTYIQSHKPATMQVMWYDSMTSDGSIDWQNALNDKNAMFLQQNKKPVSDSMFLNFWWKELDSSAKKAKSLNRSPYDLYAGIDVEANGYNTNLPWQTWFPEGKSPVTALGIYRPDWAYNTADNMEDFFARESRFWVGEKGDPSHTQTASTWKGIANYVIEQTPVNKLPFTTNFNTGSGKQFYVEGQRSSEQAWNNRSLQDVLPTWRWLTESKGQALKASFDWSTAYNGGSSLKVEGKLSPENATHLKLYQTDLRVDARTQLSITYKTELSPALKVGLAFADHPDQFMFLDVKDSINKDWTTASFNLTKYAGKRIAAISLNFDSTKTVDHYSISIGQLSVSNVKDAEAVLPAVKDLKVLAADYRDGIYGDARLQWNPLGKNETSYDVYRVYPDGKEEWLGATPNHVYYVPEMKRAGRENQTILKVVAVDAANQRGKSAEVVYTWPAYPKPVAQFKTDRTLLAPGDKVSFNDLSSEVTEDWAWSFEGGTPAASTDKNPVVTYQQEGTFSVTLTAKNSVGEQSLTKTALITVTKLASGGVKNLALNKTATADGACGPNETASRAVDGKVADNSKWCANSSQPHWITVDLGGAHLISEFIIKHAEAGGEAAAFNTKDYKLQISNDGSTWTDVVSVVGNTSGETKDAISLTKARYVKLNILKATQGGDTAARIYELEVNGLE